MGITRKKLAKMFPEGYWNAWHGHFQHNFFDMHVDRTLEYDKVLGDRIDCQDVLEIGAFPGLLMAWLLERDCLVTAMDQPGWLPDYYHGWCAEHGIPNLVHDITEDFPPVLFDRRYPQDYREPWDYAIMSDVLIHMDGLPMAFLDWFASCANHIVISIPKSHVQASYPVRPVSETTLDNSWDVPSIEAIIEVMEGYDCSKPETLETSTRLILVMEGA